MTHDEMLAKIDIWKFQTKGYEDTYEVHGILNALRAVVEYTKPNDWDFTDEKYNKIEIFKIIEKELG